MASEKIYFTEEGSVIVRPYMLQDLAAIYEVSSKTMRRWLNELAPHDGKKTKKFFTALQVSAIIKALGNPSSIILKQVS